jgi:putative transposase
MTPALLWSSYAFNSLGKEDQLVTSHSEYRRIGATEQDSQSAYRQLFRARIPSMPLEALREAANKAWVLGGERFKACVSKQIDRRYNPVDMVATGNLRHIGVVKR